MTSQRRQESGFTLLELLIALVLVALIVTLLFGGIRLGNRSWDSVDSMSERFSEMRLVWRFLHDRTAQARAIEIPTDEGPKAAFFGTRDSLEFVSPMAAHLGVSGLYMLRLQPSDGALKLTRWLYHPDLMEGAAGIPEWRPLAESDSDPGEGPADMRAYYSQSRLVDQLKGFELEYYGLAEGDTENAWQEDWEEPQMPALIRMRIRDHKGDWPEIILGVGQ